MCFSWYVRILLQPAWAPLRGSQKLKNHNLFWLESQLQNMHGASLYYWVTLRFSPGVLFFCSSVSRPCLLLLPLLLPLSPPWERQALKSSSPTSSSPSSAVVVGRRNNTVDFHEDFCREFKQWCPCTRCRSRAAGSGVWPWRATSSRALRSFPILAR